MKTKNQIIDTETVTQTETKTVRYDGYRLRLTTTVTPNGLIIRLADIPKCSPKRRRRKRTSPPPLPPKINSITFYLPNAFSTMN
jgi:hypothetical protein